MLQTQGPSGLGRHIAASALAVSVFCTGVAGPASAQQPIEKLIAAFLFQFTKYVEWPREAFENKDEPLRICVYADDDFYDVIAATMKGKSAGKRSIEVSRFDPYGEDLRCHILFIEDEEDDTWESIQSSFAEKPILTVSTTRSFTHRGGIVRLFQKETRLGIEINVDAGDRARLKISSRLLELAQIVRDEESS